MTIAAILAAAVSAPAEPGAQRPRIRRAAPGGAKPAKPAARPPAEAIVYRSAFETGKTDGWSSDKPLPLDKAKGIFHRLHNQTVRLALPKLPPHQFLRLRMDLYVIDSWDGMGGVSAPDRMVIKLTGGPTLLDTTFAVVQHSSQAYPDNGSWAGHPAGTGQAEAVAPAGSRYRLEFTFPHAEPKATVELTARLVEHVAQNCNAANESWALGGAVVSVLSEPLVKLDGKRFADLWARLAGTDAVKANEAVWTLAAAGPAAVPHLGKAYGLIGDPALAKRVAELIRRLDVDDWRRREQATQQLISLGPRAHAQLRAAMAANPSPEVKSRIEHILGTGKLSAAEQLRLARARWALQVIGGEDARAMLSKLPKPAKPKPPTRRGTDVDILRARSTGLPVTFHAAQRLTERRKRVLDGDTRVQD